MRSSFGVLGLVLWVSTSARGPAKVAPPPPAARLELSPAALLLPSIGATAKLQLRAFDAEGKPVAAPAVTYTSSTANVAVAADGTVTGSALGTSRITAAAGALSAVATVLVAEPVAGAVLVSDAQVVGALRPLDAAAPVDVGYRYDVTLQGVTPPAVGGFIVGTGALPVGGRVVAVSGNDVTLELVPLDDLFARLLLDETLDLKDAPLAISAALREHFDVEQTPEGGLHLNLKPGTQLSSSTRKRTRAPGTLEFEAGPLECAVEASAFQLTLAKLEITLDPGLSVQRVFDGQHKRVVVTSNARAGITVKPVLQSQLETKLSCTLEIGKRHIPLPGPVGLVLGFAVPFGVGFEVEAKAPILGNISVEFKKGGDGHRAGGRGLQPRVFSGGRLLQHHRRQQQLGDAQRGAGLPHRAQGGRQRLRLRQPRVRRQPVGAIGGRGDGLPPVGRGPLRVQGGPEAGGQVHPGPGHLAPGHVEPRQAHLPGGR